MVQDAINIDTGELPEKSAEAAALADAGHNVDVVFRGGYPIFKKDTVYLSRLLQPGKGAINIIGGSINSGEKDVPLTAKMMRAFPIRYNSEFNEGNLFMLCQPDSMDVLNGSTELPYYRVDATINYGDGEAFNYVVPNGVMLDQPIIDARMMQKLGGYPGEIAVEEESQNGEFPQFRFVTDEFLSSYSSPAAPNSGMSYVFKTDPIITTHYDWMRVTDSKGLEEFRKGAISIDTLADSTKHMSLQKINASTERMRQGNERIRPVIDNTNIIRCIFTKAKEYTDSNGSTYLYTDYADGWFIKTIDNLGDRNELELELYAEELIFVTSYNAFILVISVTTLAERDFNAIARLNDIYKRPDGKSAITYYPGSTTNFFNNHILTLPGFGSKYPGGWEIFELPEGKKVRGL